MGDEAGSIEQLQFFRTRVGSTLEQYRGTQGIWFPPLVGIYYDRS